MTAAVAVVTDSTSDLDAAFAARAGIDVVPLFVHFGDVRYRDSIDLSRDAFYEKLRDDVALPATAQPTPAMFEDAFRPHVAAGRAVVCVTIMSALSGTINAATAAARQFPDARIHIVDSGSVSGGLALQALHAAALAQSGAAAPAIVTALALDRERGRGYATIPDLTHAVRTGRVSRAQSFVGSLVKIVPVLRLDSGRVDEAARVRTFARAQETMIDSAAHDADVPGGARVCVVHTRAPELAASIAERLRARLSAPPISFDVLEAGPVIGTHAGAGAAGIFVLPA